MSDLGLLEITEREPWFLDSVVGRVLHALADCGSRKTNIATLICDSALVGLSPPLRALYLVYGGLPLLR